MKKKMKTENPYVISYLGLAMLCCILLSVLFLFINLQNTKKQEEIHTREKLCLIAEDMERQFASFKKMNLLLSVNTIYQPFYFTRNKYYEMTLLNDFSQYQNYSPLISEYFLYYQNYDTIFHSEEYTTDLSTYLADYDKEEQKKLTRLLNSAKSTCFFYSPDSLFVLMPISSIHTNDVPKAVLCIVIDSNTLCQRFWTVSGGLDGNLTLYSGEQLLYTGTPVPYEKAVSHSTKETFVQKQEEDFTPASASYEDQLSYHTPEGQFYISYLPSEKGRLSSILLPLPILLILSVVIFLLFLASLFARHSYKPLVCLAQKCKRSLPSLSSDVSFCNKLEELNYMMESMLKKNVTATEKLEEYQELLRSQLLILLLNGKYSFDISPYLSQAKLIFPGSCYFVICTRFSKNMENESDFYYKMKKRYESLNDPEDQIYIYSVIHPEEMLISSLISISDACQKEDLFHDFQSLSEDILPAPLLGCGNIYHDLNHLSASYLEALDNTKILSPAQEMQKTILPIHPSDLYPVINAISTGNETAAMDAMSTYLSKMKQAMSSLLMQQYLFTYFLNELMRLCREYQIELSKQSISLIISAKEPDQFSFAASLAIHEFCCKFQEQKSRLSKDKSYQVYQYINRNFTNYELSIENVAKDLQTTTAFVRNSIQEHTGKNYKDYLISLRMEYAKKLLVSDRLSVAETCQKVGYTNISYFIKAFKNLTGVTPANYKNNP